MSGDRITPTGLLATLAEPGTDEWFAARREGITGTDLPKILGYSKYGNALHVWMDKRGELDDQAGEAAEWGHILEDPVAQQWAKLNGTAASPVGVLYRDGAPWQRASLDRLVHRCPDATEGADRLVCGLEVKTRNAYVEGRYRGGIPDDVLAQVLWGLIVTGLDHMHVAVLIGGQELRSFRVDRDDEIEGYLIEQATPVWQAVLEGFPPEVEADAEGLLLDLLNRVYTDRSGDRNLDPADADPLLEQYRMGGDLEREGERLKTQAKTALVQMLDDGDAGLVDGVLAFTYKRPAPRHSMPADEVRRLQAEHPRVFARLVKQGFLALSQGSPRFNLSKGKGK